jgi:cytochrome P450
MRNYQTLDQQSSAYIAHTATESLKPVGPPAAPLLGWLLHKRRFWSDPVGYLDATYKEYGLMSALGSQPPQCVFSFSPESHQRLNEDPDLFHWTSGRQWAAGDSPLGILRKSIGNMDGEDYRTRRVLMTPAFNHHMLPAWQDSMVALTERTIATWRSGDVRDAHEELNKLVHAIAMRTVLGIHDTGLVDQIYALVKQVYKTTANPAALLLPFNLPATPYRRMLRTVTQMVDTLRGLVAEKRVAGGEPTDMLGAMMAARTQQGVSMSDTELISEAYNIMGHETTMGALIWTLILIALHPTVYAGVVDELAGVLRGAAPTLPDLARLVWLDRVIKESMRLLPPQAFSRRFNTQPCSFGPYELPKGVAIIFSSYITHRLSSLYANPQEFRPERWETAKPSAFEYFPFGSGAHYCLGRTFAVMEIKIVLAILLQRFRLEMIPGQRIDRQPRSLLLLRPGGEIHVKVSPPDRQFRPCTITGNLSEMVNLS